MNISKIQLAKILTVTTTIAVAKYGNHQFQPNTVLQLFKAFKNDLDKPEFFKYVELNFHLLTEQK